LQVVNYKPIHCHPAKPPFTNPNTQNLN